LLIELLDEPPRYLDTSLNYGREHLSYSKRI
jgi:hypothetical protein